jgi:hypothetical protein
LLGQGEGILIYASLYLGRQFSLRGRHDRIYQRHIGAIIMKVSLIALIAGCAVAISASAIPSSMPGMGARTVLADSLPPSPPHVVLADSLPPSPPHVVLADSLPPSPPHVVLADSLPPSPPHVVLADSLPPSPPHMALD